MPLEGLWTKLQAYKWMSRKDMNHQANNNFLHFPGDILAFTVIWAFLDVFCKAYKCQAYLFW